MTRMFGNISKVKRPPRRRPCLSQTLQVSSEFAKQHPAWQFRVSPCAVAGNVDSDGDHSPPRAVSVLTKLNTHVAYRHPGCSLHRLASCLCRRPRIFQKGLATLVNSHVDSKTYHQTAPPRPTPRLRGLVCSPPCLQSLMYLSVKTLGPPCTPRGHGWLVRLDETSMMGFLCCQYPFKYNEAFTSRSLNRYLPRLQYRLRWAKLLPL